MKKTFLAKVFYLLLMISMIYTTSYSQEGPYEKGEIVALAYHRFGDDRYPSTNITTAAFEKHLKYLKQHNYHVMTLSDACNQLFYGRGVPAKTVVLTIDDAYKSFYNNGFPLLQEYNFPATIFINTANVGDGDFMNWNEIMTIMNAGIEIGNHSHSHPYFLNENLKSRKELLQDEIDISQDLFMDNIDNAPVVFSYPFGEYDASMVDIVEQSGFSFAAAQNSGVISILSNEYGLPRFPMNERYGRLESFISKIQMHALPVIKTEPDDPFFGENPPVLFITIDADYIDEDQLQCFIAGSTSCNMTINDYNGKIRVKLESQNPLSSRRTLYTVTAPFAKGNGWCWYSFVWVDPSVNE